MLRRIVVEPDDIDHLLDEQRVGGQFETSVRCGFNSNLRQIRPMVDSDRPLCCAIDVRDQCVALAGVCSNVAIRISSTLSSRIEGGRPRRFSSASPSRRRRVNLPRQRATVPAVVPSSAATCRFEAPGCAHASTIRDRNAIACDDLARRPAHQLLTLHIGQNQDGLRPPQALLIAQPIQPRLDKPATPRDHSVRSDTQILGDRYQKRPAVHMPTRSAPAKPPAATPHDHVTTAPAGHAPHQTDSIRPLAVPSSPPAEPAKLFYQFIYLT